MKRKTKRLYPMSYAAVVEEKRISREVGLTEGIRRGEESMRKTMAAEIEKERNKVRPQLTEILHSLTQSNEAIARAVVTFCSEGGLQRP